MGKLLVNDRYIPVLPRLAEAIGLNQAIFLQQLHYWLNTYRELEDDYHFRDGRWWVWNTYEGWQKNFSWWSLRTVARILSSLRDSGLIITTDRYNQKGYDNTLWYTINYEKVGSAMSECQCSPCQSDMVPHDNVAGPIPYITTESTSENTNPPAADEEDANVPKQEAPEPSPPGSEDRETGRRNGDPRGGSAITENHLEKDKDRRREAIEEPEYVPLDEDGWPERKKHPVVSFIEAESRNLGVKRRITPCQQGRLARQVQESKAYPSPADLFLQDPDFRDWMYEQIAWANRVDGRKRTELLISAIRHYERPGNGWLSYKQEVEEERAERRSGAGSKPDQAQARGDGASGDSGGPEKYRNPTLEELDAYFQGA